MSQGRIASEVKEIKGLEKMKSRSNGKGLFCFDFDQTIAKEHVHNAIMHYVRSDSSVESNEEKQWTIAKAIAPRATAEKWKNLFTKLNQEGHQIAIVAFNKFPHIIKRYLKKIINLPDALLEKIYIHSWCPNIIKDKNCHIDQVVTYYKSNNKYVVLVDDSADDLKEASSRLHADGGILVDDQSDDFFKKIENLMDKFNQEFAQEEMKKTEAEAKKFIAEIKKRIADTTWPVTGMLGSLWGETIRLDDESTKTVPKNVKLQWLEIRAAEFEKKTYAEALAEIKRIGTLAAQGANYWRDAKVTQPYYDLFLESKQVQFQEAFRR